MNGWDILTVGKRGSALSLCRKFMFMRV